MSKSSKTVCQQDWTKYERSLRQEGVCLPAGVDEVGRGCLAGPVVAAAVIFPENVEIKGINDSKKLSASLRLKLYAIILRKALSYGIAMVSPQEIDQINILQASLVAMRKAIEKLSPTPDYLLIDGRDPVPHVLVKQRPIIGGDGQCLSIAAASIVAKVTRDRLMHFYGLQYPNYCFEQHKGYGTLEHRQRLQQWGPCPIHRRSFSGVLL